MKNKKQILSILFFLAATGTVMGQNQTTPAVQIPDSLQILDKDPNFTTYTAAGFDQCWAAYPGAQLVDVRTADEYAKGHIASARNIDVKKETFLQEADSLLDKSKPVAVYCKGGVRSRMAAKQLLSKGFMVYNLQDGYDGWFRYQEGK